MAIILQKIIAASGLASRREAERLISRGRVRVNGLTAHPGDLADPKKDQIVVNGRPLPEKEKAVYIKMNKPVGYTCTTRRFPGEKNIFALLPKTSRLHIVGRLDKDSRGLLLLTNDGALSERLAHPRYGHEKEYEVRIGRGAKNSEEIAAKLKKGVDIGEGDGRVKAKEAKCLQNPLFIITLNEGKKRQIRRMFRALGLEVSRLKRTRIGSLELGHLAPGRWEYLSEKEIINLKKYEKQ